MKAKKILILGSTGYIGSVLIEKLIELNYSVYAYRRGGLVTKKNKKINYIYGDLSTNKFWRKNIKNKDYLINLISNENKFGLEVDFINNFEINVKIMMHALKAAKEFNKKIKILSLGSENQHGIANKIPVNEKYEDKPVTFFAINKLIIEKYMSFFSDNFKIQTINLRLPNVYGPTYDIKNFLKISLNKIIYNAIKGEINLYKNQKCIRDFLFIDDAIDAILVSLQKFDKLKDKYYYIGSGRGISILDLSNKIKDIVIKKKMIKKIKTINHKIKLNKFDYRNFVADYKKFEKVTGWKPKNNKNQGIVKTINYLIKDI